MNTIPLQQRDEFVDGETGLLDDGAKDGLPKVAPLVKGHRCLPGGISGMDEAVMTAGYSHNDEASAH